MVKKSIEAYSSGTQALRRVARNFIPRAARALVSSDLSDTAVHDARKDLKRLYGSCGRHSTNRFIAGENALLRDAAHALNAARDAKVVTQTLQSLRRSHRALRRDADVTELLRTLQADQTGLRRVREHPAQLARRAAPSSNCAAV